MSYRSCFTHIFIIVSLFLFLTKVGADEIPSVDFLLEQVQNNLALTTDVSARVVLTQQKVEQGTKTIDMIYHRKDLDDAFLIVMVAPENEKGNGYLRVKDNFWMYRVNTRTFQHINRDESIAGTDVNADDFEKRKLIDMYVADAGPDGQDVPLKTMLGKIPVYQFNIKAKVNDVDYPKKTYWVRTDNYLPLKEQSFSLSDSLMQTAYYKKYTEVNGRYVAIELIFIDEFEKGNKTIVEVSDIQTDNLDDKIFTKAYLENLSK